MSYEELKTTVLALLPSADTCYDCGGVLHFICEHDDTKGVSIAIHKETGEIIPFVMCIELGLVNNETKLDFITGLPV